MVRVSRSTAKRGAACTARPSKPGAGAAPDGVAFYPMVAVIGSCLPPPEGLRRRFTRSASSRMASLAGP
eukprot:12029048-Alexandrium_andersonii.AAC.1